MKTQFSYSRIAEAVRAGHAAAIINALKEDHGLVFDEHPQFDRNMDVQWLHRRDDTGKIDRMALDAQPELVTQSNAGIPAFLSNFVDPKLIRILVSPMKAATIVGEKKVGDWLTTVATFLTIESTGEVSSYGDYSNNGSVSVNTNFPQRQSYHYQTFTQWGEKQLAFASLAKIDEAAQQNIASVLLLNKFQNFSYFFGIGNLQNYGLLNDPALYAPIAPTYSWLTSASATAATVYQDIVRLFIQLQGQADGVIDQMSPMVLAMSPQQSVALNYTNEFNVNVFDQIKKNFPNMRVEVAVEYSTVSGQLVQMIVEEIDGQRTAECAFTEKMRAHAIVVESSSWKQKKSQGTYGTVIYRPFAIAQMLG
jgi:hypothetical protein